MPGFTSYVAIVPELGLSVVFTMEKFGSAENFLAMIMPKLITSLSTAITHAPALPIPGKLGAEAYLGIYVDTSGSITVEKGHRPGSLVIHVQTCI